MEHIAATRLICWAARVWSICSIALLLGFVIGEGINPTTSAERIGLLFCPLGLCIGMVVAWWREGLGGGITVGSLLVFYAIYFANAGTLSKAFNWLLFAAPGFLFLLYWQLSRKSNKTRPVTG
jgi:hypothetical protein